MFDIIKRERTIRKALRAIARQRVALILQPGNIIVVEQSPPNEDWFDLAVRTCHIRGWVDVLHDSIPSGVVRYEGETPILPEQMKSKTIYRLTEGGWSVIHRSHGWLIGTFAVGLLSLFAGIASVVVTLVINGVRL
jgi:hypothetical protein